jgi:cyclase
MLNLQRGPAAEPQACFGRPRAGEVCKPLLPLALACQNAGAGELLIHDVDREGGGEGLDVPLLAALNDQLTIPLVGLGGCGNHAHIEELLARTPLSGVAAGSLFA